MTQRFTLIIILSLLIFAANSYALEIADNEVEITVADVFVSRYIWRGQDLFGDNDDAFQPSVDITFPKLIAGTDIGFNVWGAFPLNGGHEDAEELDYTVSFSKDVLDDAYSLAAGYTYFDYPNTASTSDVSESWFSVTLNEIPNLPHLVSFTTFFAYDFQAKSGGPDEGWYYSWGFDTEISTPKECPLFQDGQTLALGIVNWGNDGVADLEPSFVYATDLSISTTYEVSGFSISPSLNYSINHEDKINSGDDEFWTGLEVSYAF